MGEELHRENELYINGMPVGNIKSLSINDEVFKSNRIINIPREMSFTIDNCQLNEEWLLGMDLSNQPDKYTISYIQMIQNRTHRKKRINKKWAKRYGYSKLIHELPNVKIDMM